MAAMSARERGVVAMDAKMSANIADHHATFAGHVNFCRLPNRGGVWKLFHAMMNFLLDSGMSLA